MHAKIDFTIRHWLVTKSAHNLSLLWISLPINWSWLTTHNAWTGSLRQGATHCISCEVMKLILSILRQSSAGDQHPPRTPSQTTRSTPQVLMRFSVTRDRERLLKQTALTWLRPASTRTILTTWKLEKKHKSECILTLKVHLQISYKASSCLCSLK